jgi:hypothetical protein
VEPAISVAQSELPFEPIHPTTLIFAKDIRKDAVSGRESGWKPYLILSAT